jgi:hypothetical protein
MKLICQIFVTSLITSILMISHVQAQESENLSPLQEGSRALQFQISENFNLESFSGTVFSYKRQLSDQKATRIGLSLSSQYAVTDYPDAINDQNNSIMHFNLGLSYSTMNYINPDSEIKFYYGYGPGVNFGYNRTVQDETNSKIINRSSLYGISGIGYTGVEWFFHSSMSLHAEYQSSIRLNHRRIKQTNEQNATDNSTRTNSTVFSLGGDGVKFGLSVYF